MDNHYPIKIDAEIIAKLSVLDALNQEVQQYKQQASHSDLWNVVMEKLRSSWTYHSNAIEGSTLSLGDTIFFLKEGLTIQGKPFKDFLAARNHAEAIDYLFEVIINERPITTGLIKDINSLLLQGTQSTPAITTEGKKVQKPLNAGQYKLLPNHVLTQQGNIHRYVEPEQVSAQMDFLVQFIQRTELHPVVSAAIAHYNMVRIHPFDDGNGRGARILMNLILMKAKYFPAVIKQENKPEYLTALNQADLGDLNPFILFIIKQLENTLIDVIQDLNIK